MSRTREKGAVAAATVVVLRDADEGVELLLLRRNPDLAFLGGAWVFPGGRIDPEDFEPGSETDLAAAAKRAAVREVYEEAGLTLRSESLVYISRWVPPPQAPKRFATRFYAAPVEAAVPVRVDGEEIHDFRWVSAQSALDAQQKAEIRIAPPTFITIHSLLGFDSREAVFSALREREVETFCPRIVPASNGEGAYCLYHGDVAYESRSLDAKGPRHRLFMHDLGWEYQRTAQ